MCFLLIFLTLLSSPCLGSSELHARGKTCLLPSSVLHSLLVPGSPVDTQIYDDQVPSIKQLRIVHTVGPMYPWIPKLGWKRLFLVRSWLNLWMRNLGMQRANCVFTEKTNLCISGPRQFKPVFFKGQL